MIGKHVTVGSDCLQLTGCGRNILNSSENKIPMQLQWCASTHNMGNTYQLEFTCVSCLVFPLWWFSYFIFHISLQQTTFSFLSSLLVILLPKTWVTTSCCSSWTKLIIAFRISGRRWGVKVPQWPLITPWHVDWFVNNKDTDAEELQYFSNE